MKPTDKVKEINTKEEAKAEGRRMAKEAFKKLEPQIKDVAETINKANDRIYEDGRKAGRKEVVEWIENRGGILEFINMHYDEEWEANLKEWGLAP